MAHACSKCNRVNPPEAVYCYYDGMVLDGHGRNGGPVSVGARPFPSQFVFPSGRSCRNFDELALGCQNEWPAARSLLEQGLFERFLGGLGRADLALAAREAARFPDRDRGLDQLLAALPSSVLPPAQLQVEPGEVNLGQMQIGQDRTIELHLDNTGKRLLFGTVSVEDCPWLSVGDARGTPQKLFQFGSDQTMPIHVMGKRLRASNKPVEARLVIDSNGGSQTVRVRAEVPIKPFADGVLAGARSPRQVAEKAREKPKEAAVLFEKGAVAKWYKENGWTYPVQAPSSSGLGAVQQFFEALGLTPPPKVGISERSVALQGSPGDKLRHTLEVRTQEKRPVWAHATSDQGWLEVGRPQLNGRTAVIPLVVPSVPRRDGETLTAKVVVTSNGNQRFVVPVTLAVGGGFDFGAPEPVLAAVAEPAAAAPVPDDDLTVAPVIRSRAASSGMSPLHVLPLLLLLVVLGGLVAWDLLGATGPGPKTKAPSPSNVSSFTWDDLKDRDPCIDLEFQNELQRFGIVMVRDPVTGKPAEDVNNPGQKKRLTFEVNGHTNNTCLRIDGTKEPLYWLKPGRRVLQRTELHKLREFKDDPSIKERRGWVSEWKSEPENIHVRQHVELVPGMNTRRFDTCLIWYTVENKSEARHTVGLRVMLDTYIGAEDGVPFLIPGVRGVMDTQIEIEQKDMPDYVVALEHPFVEPEKSGTRVRLGLKGIELPNIQMEPIDKLIICRWPGNEEVRWEWPYASMKEQGTGKRPKDSCVVLYWLERRMAPGERRDLAFTYGLSEIATGSSGGMLGLLVSDWLRVGQPFTLTATVRNPQKGQTVKLDGLPGGLSLVKGYEWEQTVDDQHTVSQVSWKVLPDDPGEFTLKVTSGALSEQIKIKVLQGGIFQGR